MAIQVKKNSSQTNSIGNLPIVQLSSVETTSLHLRSIQRSNRQVSVIFEEADLPTKLHIKIQQSLRYYHVFVIFVFHTYFNCIRMSLQNYLLHGRRNFTQFLQVIQYSDNFSKVEYIIGGGGSLPSSTSDNTSNCVSSLDNIVFPPQQCLCNVILEHGN